MSQQLLFFVLGIMFIEFVIPIIEALSVLLAAIIEIPKGKAMVVVSQCNKQIQDLSEDKESPHNAIGFSISNYADESEEEEG